MGGVRESLNRGNETCDYACMENFQDYFRRYSRTVVGRTFLARVLVPVVHLSNKDLDQRCFCKGGFHKVVGHEGLSLEEVHHRHNKVHYYKGVDRLEHAHSDHDHHNRDESSYYEKSEAGVDTKEVHIHYCNLGGTRCLGAHKSLFHDFHGCLRES